MLKYTLNLLYLHLLNKIVHRARKNILPNIPQSLDEVYKSLNKLNIKTY